MTCGHPVHPLLHCFSMYITEELFLGSKPCTGPDCQHGCYVPLACSASILHASAAGGAGCLCCDQQRPGKRVNNMMLSLYACMLQEQAHHSEVSIACGRIDHVTLNAVAFQARPSTAPPQKPSRPLSCQTQRVRPATASAAGTATRRRLSPSAGPCGLYSSMSFGVLDSDTESEPGATSQVRTQRAVARFQGQTAPRDKLFPLAGGCSLLSAVSSKQESARALVT